MLTCTVCREEFERKPGPGRPPTKCPTHQKKSAAPKAATATSKTGGPKLPPAVQRDVELYTAVASANRKAFLTMIAARCVQPDHGNSAFDPSEFSEGKVSANAFAKASEISDKTVTKYLRTWDLMAEKGVVPKRSELKPGKDVDPLPDKDLWTQYYRQANPQPEPKAVEPATVTPVTASVVTAQFDRVRADVNTVPGDVGDGLRRLVDELAAIPVPTDPGPYLGMLESVAQIAASVSASRLVAVS
jgi:hypothetical protein